VEGYKENLVNHMINLSLFLPLATTLICSF